MRRLLTALVALRTCVAPHDMHAMVMRSGVIIKRLYLTRRTGIAGVVIAVPAALGTFAALRSSLATTEPPVSYATCGELEYLGPYGIGEDLDLLQNAENCFWRLYHQRHNATLTAFASYSDGGDTHVFTVEWVGHVAAILDTITAQGNGSTPVVSSVTCRTLVRRAQGLTFLACGAKRDYTIVLPVHYLDGGYAVNLVNGLRSDGAAPTGPGLPQVVVRSRVVPAPAFGV